MKYYYCDAFHYCFEYPSLPDRCPDSGKTQWGENPAVRPATEKEIADLLRARAADDEKAATPPVFMGGVSFTDNHDGTAPVRQRAGQVSPSPAP